MAYSNNPYLPNVRRQAIQLVVSGLSCARVAARIGVHRTTVWRWLRWPGAKDGRVKLVNRSCRPHGHAKQLAQAVTKRDKNWQKKVEKRVKAEKVELGHPNGKERFDQTIKRINKKKED